MSRKIPVQFRKFSKSAHLFQRLKYCKGCGNFSVLETEACPGCGKEDRQISAEAFARTLSRRTFQTRSVYLAAFLLLGVLAARNLWEIALASVGGAAILALAFFLHRRYREDIESHRFHQLLEQENASIREGIGKDVDLAVADIKAENYKAAYEKLREIGLFFLDDRIKLRKIMCLNQFVLRKDMDLELDTLVPTHFDIDFVRYLQEVVKVNNLLVKKKTIDYAVRNRVLIEAMEGGRELLVGIAGAALRMKGYVKAHPRFIADFMGELPKERFLRLCRMVAENPAEWPELFVEVRETARMRYGFDPDVQGIL